MASPAYSYTASLLLPDDFVVAPPCAFANNPSRRGLERPPVSGDRRAVASHGRRQTPRAAVGRVEHAVLRLERAPGARHAIGMEVHGPGVWNHHGTQGIRGARASSRHHEHRAVDESPT